MKQCRYGEAPVLRVPRRMEGPRDLRRVEHSARINDRAVELHFGCEDRLEERRIVVDVVALRCSVDLHVSIERELIVADVLRRDLFVSRSSMSVEGRAAKSRVA